MQMPIQHNILLQSPRNSAYMTKNISHILVKANKTVI